MRDFEFYKIIRLSTNKKVQKAFLKLRSIYAAIPETKGCMANITEGAGCRAWCCCLPCTRIYTKKGLLPIKNLRAGDEVYTKSGQFRKIVEITNRNVNEEIVSIKSCYGRNMKLTKDHLILVDSFKRKNREKVKDPVWVRADELISKNGKNKLGHYLIFPKYFSQDIDSNEIYISNFLKDIFIEDGQCFPSSCKRGKSISNSIRLSYDFCWIIGLYLAEGSCGDSSTEFHINLEETEIFEKIKLFSNRLNLNFSSRIIRGKSFTVRVFSRVLKRFFQTICGKGCDNKKLNDELFSFIIKNKKLRQGLHDGYYAGDGTKKLPNKTKYSITTTSKELYYQIMMLNWMNNEIPVGYKKERSEKKDIFSLNISNGKYKDYVETKIDFRVPVRDVSYEKYNGLVYDIEVEEDHSFYTECGEIHNCMIQTPQLLYSEFLLIWQYISSQWNDSRVCDLLESCMLNAVNPIPSKQCVFFDEDLCMCKCHDVRPYNCRIYGITPDEVFEPRYEKLKEEYKVIVGAIIKPQCDLVSVCDNTEITVKDIDRWWDKIIKVERYLGIPKDMINDSMGGSYRSPHDHILLYNMPDNVLNALAGIKLYDSEFDKKKAITELIQVIRNVFKSKS